MTNQKAVSKIARGQVWYINEDTFDTNRKIENSHLAAKSRPWLVISCPENNLYAPIFNAVPISTVDGPDGLPPHVYFVNTTYNQYRHQIVQCEQIRTFDIPDLYKRGSYYMFNLSDQLMRQVDVALIGQLSLGLDSVVSNLDGLVALVSQLIDLAANQQSRLTNERQNAADMLSAALEGAINKCLGTLSTPPVIKVPVIEESSKELCSKIEVKPKRPYNRINPPRKRGFWTTEQKREFLNDCDTLTTEQVIDKWNLSGTSVFNSYRIKFRSDLANEK